MSPGLNRQQNRAIITPGHLLVLAIPGSGKTRVLTERACHLLDKCRQKHIIAVTFTREAAKEFKARISKLIPDTKGVITIGTFHALALEQLRETKLPQKLINDATRLTILRHIWKHSGKGLDLNAIGHAIEQHKSQTTANSEEAETLDIYHAYQEALRRKNAIDFQDLLIQAVEGMKKGTIAPLFGNTLLVDEFQDTDSVQYAWIKAHAQHMDVTVVGDDDQTIFSWRHAMGYQGMCLFEREFSATRIQLELNYRCCPEILAVADKLIQYNQKRCRKELCAYKPKGGKVHAFSYSNDLDEAMDIAKIARVDPNNTAVLSRVNRRLDLIEKTLTSADIPYYRIGGKRLWERRHVGVLLDLLGSIHDRSNLGIEHSLVFAGFDETEITTIYSMTNDQLINIIKPDLPQQQLMKPAHEKILASFKKSLNGWRQQYAKKYTDLLIYDATEWLSKHAPSTRQKEDITIAGDVLAQMRGSLAVRLTSIKNLTRKKTHEGVALMTLHGAKGLEFKRVWMMGVEERILPHEDAETEEERRLCYVGVTRAMEYLYLSAATSSNPASRFFDEMGLTPEIIPASLETSSETELE